MLGLIILFAYALHFIVDYKDVVIPFGTIFSTQEHKQEYFLPCVPVRITITERIHQPASHRLNPILCVDFLLLLFIVKRFVFPKKILSILAMLST